MRRNFVSLAVTVFAIAAIGPAHAVAQFQLPWSLSDYPTGGSAMTGMVAGTLQRQGDLTISTCNTLGAGNVQQITSGVTGIGQSIANSESDNAALIVDQLPQCCEVFTSLDIDSRITLGAAIALATRVVGEKDMRSAQEIEFVIEACDDEILQRSYQVARGQDNLGQLIAQEDGESNPSLTTPPVTPTGSGGVPSPN